MTLTFKGSMPPPPEPRTELVWVHQPPEFPDAKAAAEKALGVLKGKV